VKKNSPPPLKFQNIFPDIFADPMMGWVVVAGWPALAGRLLLACVDGWLDGWLAACWMVREWMAGCWLAWFLLGVGG
jgi:hypothetical protein